MAYNKGNSIDKLKQKYWEVQYYNHMHEFIRFYEKQSIFCDVILGMKDFIFYDNGNEKKITIQKENVYNAIKFLNSFFIDNTQYFVNKQNMRYIEEQIEKLEEDHIDDKTYKHYLDLVKNKAKLSLDQKIDFNKRYFNIIMKCLKLYSKILVELQATLMLSTKSIIKSVLYYDFTTFYNNLAKYRDSISNDLSNFQYKNLINHSKRIIGYVSTYEIFINKKDKKMLGLLIDNVIELIMKREIMTNVVNLNNNNVRSDDVVPIRKQGKEIKKILTNIYRITNQSLSEKNILPKAREIQRTDKTLI